PPVLEFPLTDSTAFQEAVWLRNVASWASGEEMDDPIKPAVALFDWVIKNVQLVREPADDPSNPLQHVFQTPMETLLFGQGTGIDRAWLFVLLARQRNIDAALLGLVDENNAVTRLWGVGVLIDGQVYLFEPVLGMPIPKPGSQKLGESGLSFEPATLAEAAANDEVLRQLDIFKEGDYVIRSKDLQRVVVLVEASPVCLSQRMKMVEKRLTGDQKIVLTADATGQIERFKRSEHVVDGRMWPLPYQTIWQGIRFAPERANWFAAMAAPLVFPPQMPILWKARSYHFKGQFTGNPSATMFYLAARQSEFATESATTNPAEKQMWREIKIDASYWLGLMVAQTGNYRAAEDYLKTRVLMADPGGKWEQGAAYNLARVSEATGDIPMAIKLLELHTAAAQAQGNVIRAGWLRKLTGQPPLAAKAESGDAASEAATPGETQPGKPAEKVPDSKPGDAKPGDAKADEEGKTGDAGPEGSKEASGMPAPKADVAAPKAGEVKDKAEEKGGEAGPAGAKDSAGAPTPKADAPEPKPDEAKAEAEEKGGPEAPKDTNGQPS
ncbi:MAG: tetratricopeptide repeat protein, partial [Thermoguttaceae bacterium]